MLSVPEIFVNLLPVPDLKCQAMGKIDPAYMSPQGIVAGEKGGFMSTLLKTTLNQYNLSPEEISDIETMITHGGGIKVCLKSLVATLDEGFFNDNTDDQTVEPEDLIELMGGTEGNMNAVPSELISEDEGSIRSAVSELISKDVGNVNDVLSEIISKSASDRSPLIGPEDTEKIAKAYIDALAQLNKLQNNQAAIAINESEGTTAKISLPKSAPDLSHVKASASAEPVQENIGKEDPLSQAETLQIESQNKNALYTIPSEASKIISMENIKKEGEIPEPKDNLTRSLESEGKSIGKVIGFSASEIDVYSSPDEPSEPKTVLLAALKENDKAVSGPVQRGDMMIVKDEQSAETEKGNQHSITEKPLGSIPPAKLIAKEPDLRNTEGPDMGSDTELINKTTQFTKSIQAGETNDRNTNSKPVEMQSISPDVKIDEGESELLTEKENREMAPEEDTLKNPVQIQNKNNTEASFKSENRIAYSIEKYLSKNSKEQSSQNDESSRHRMDNDIRQVINTFNQEMPALISTSNPMDPNPNSNNSIPIKSGISLGDVLQDKVIKLDGSGGGETTLFSSNNQTSEQTTEALSNTKDSQPFQKLFQTSVLNQVVDKALVNLKNGQSSIQINLRPEVLGRLRMKITTENNQVMIKILTEVPLVKDIIENNVNQLRADFQSQGLEIEKFDVSVGHESSSEEGSSPQRSVKNKKIPFDRAGIEGLEIEEKEKTSLNNNINSNLINFFA